MGSVINTKSSAACSEWHIDYVRFLAATFFLLSFFIIWFKWLWWLRWVAKVILVWRSRTSFWVLKSMSNLLSNHNFILIHSCTKLIKCLVFCLGVICWLLHPSSIVVIRLLLLICTIILINTSIKVHILSRDSLIVLFLLLTKLHLQIDLWFRPTNYYVENTKKKNQNPQNDRWNFSCYHW